MKGMLVDTPYISVFFNYFYNFLKASSRLFPNTINLPIIES